MIIKNKNKEVTKPSFDKPGHFHWYTIVGDNSSYPPDYQMKLNGRHVGYLKPLKFVSPRHLVYFGYFTENRMLQYIDTWRKQGNVERR